VPVREGRTPPVRFAHDSERRLAALFEFHDIAWEYEPVEFALDWDGGGNAVSGFRPDFFLPEYDLFVELTTLQQRLVTKKNRKLRRLRELHPEIRVEILYRRDFLNLVLTERIPFLTALPTTRTA
jgi:hypothetical protein